MNTQERHVYEAFRRSHEFGVAHISDFPAGSLGATLIADLGTTVTDIETVASAQESRISASRQGTQSRTLSREALLDELEAVALIGRGLALENAGFEKKFRAPRDLPDSGLLTLAQSFVTDATPIKADFIRHGAPADFPADLSDALSGFSEAVTDRAIRRENHVSATASFESLFAKGMKQLKHLNVVVRTVYRDDSAMLAAWTSASHIQRPSRKEKHSTPPTPGIPPSE